VDPLPSAWDRKGGAWEGSGAGSLILEHAERQNHHIKPHGVGADMQLAAPPFLCRCRPDLPDECAVNYGGCWHDEFSVGGHMKTFNACRDDIGKYKVHPPSHKSVLCRGGKPDSGVCLPPWPAPRSSPFSCTLSFMSGALRSGRAAEGLLAVHAPARVISD
jgi:hypothetical protein